jgi:hypothetical protein
MEAQTWSIFRFSRPFERWKISSNYTPGEVISFAGDKESAVALLDELAHGESGDAVELVCSVRRCTTGKD